MKREVPPKEVTNCMECNDKYNEEEGCPKCELGMDDEEVKELDDWLNKNGEVKDNQAPKEPKYKDHVFQKIHEELEEKTKQKADIDHALRVTAEYIGKVEGDLIHVKDGKWKVLYFNKWRPDTDYNQLMMLQNRLQIDFEDNMELIIGVGFTSFQGLKRYPQRFTVTAMGSHKEDIIATLFCFVEVIKKIKANGN